MGHAEMRLAPAWTESSFRLASGAAKVCKKPDLGPWLHARVGACAGGRSAGGRETPGQIPGRGPGAAESAPGLCNRGSSPVFRHGARPGSAADVPEPLPAGARSRAAGIRATKPLTTWAAGNAGAGGSCASAKNRTWDLGCRFFSRFLFKNRTWDPTCMPGWWLEPSAARRGDEKPQVGFRAAAPGTVAPAPTSLQSGSQVRFFRNAPAKNLQPRSQARFFDMGPARGLRPWGESQPSRPGTGSDPPRRVAHGGSSGLLLHTRGRDCPHGWPTRGIRARIRSRFPPRVTHRGNPSQAGRGCGPQIPPTGHPWGGFAREFARAPPRVAHGGDPSRAGQERGSDPPNGSSTRGIPAKKAGTAARNPPAGDP